ncbi:3,4-dihydroxy-2-butanone-4-phosphate synthase [Nocardia farcinica]|uniref:3,4-dihydroxy-2-butanone-4-phosphate synthase n=1 Tax=Nocardia farcinica TaxID=37329 RepID=UPI002457B6A0|nr:3,4-dihydroxy-2-butanone-4-phosphate synthase [Nocardia farcinica]
MTKDTLHQELSAVRAAIQAVGRGEPVIVVDSADRENEGDLIMAAQAASPETIAFFLRHSSGVICAAATGERLDELALPLMVEHNEESHRTAFTVTVDLAEGISTGISAADRARTLAALGDPTRSAADFVRPGHVFPLRARPGGVLERPAHTEAAVDLVRLAGLPPVGVLCEIVTEDHSAMARQTELRAFAERYGLVMISVEALVEFRNRMADDLSYVTSARIPTPAGNFSCHAWRSTHAGGEHLAFVLGDPSGSREALTMIHRECLITDTFGALPCGGSRITEALAAIAREGSGILIYLRGERSRHEGIADALRAHERQPYEYGRPAPDRGQDSASELHGYFAAARILLDLGVESIRLMTDDSRACAELRTLGVAVSEQVPLPHDQRLADVAGADVG